MHFSGLTYTVLSLFFCDPDMHPADFSLLAPRRDDEQTEMPDEDDMLMRKAAGISGGVRFGADGKEIVTVSDDMRSSTEDEAMLMMVSEGFEVYAMAGNFADLTAVLTLHYSFF